MGRGRPKKIIDNSKPILIYNQVIKNEDRSVTTWKFNKIKFPRGPYEVSTTFPPGYDFRTFEEIQLTLPKTQRRFITLDGKEVGYSRAKQLGLID